MSATELPLPAVQPRCPACSTPLAPDQNWCLQCGAAARTRIAPTPKWRTATGLLLAMVLLSIAAIGFGVARLLRSDTATTPPPTTITQTVAGAAPATPLPAPGPTAVPTTSTPAVPPRPTVKPKIPSTGAATTPAVPTTPKNPATTPTAPTNNGAKPTKP